MVELSISTFSNLRNDKVLTIDTIVSHSLQSNAGRWKKNKLDPSTLEPIIKRASEARNWVHYRYTVPWQNRGPRLLPAALHPKYEVEIKAAESKFWEEVNTWIAGYKDHIANAKTMHNGTFTASDYPGWDPNTDTVYPEVIRSQFAFGVEYSPVPDSSQFIVQLSEDKVNKMKQSFSDLAERRIQEVVTDTWSRLLDPVRHLIETLGKDKPIFRDSLIVNIKEVADIMEGLNLTGNMEMSEAAATIATMVKDLDSETLKNQPILQVEITKQANSVLSRFGQYGRQINL